MHWLLIINADDFGYDPEVTRGIAEAMRQGLVTSTTMMVNTPFSEEAAQEAKDLSVGLHLNLARNTPVAKDFPHEFLVNGQLAEALTPRLPVWVVEKEALAQLKRFEQLLGRRPTHIDVHKHLHKHDNVLDGLIKVARAQKLPVRSTDDRMRQALREGEVVTSDYFFGDAHDDAYWTMNRLEEELMRLPQKGIIEWMCHPGYAPAKIKSGYSEQREVELRTFLHPQARTMLTNHGVPLGNYASVIR
jgi:chitin disaccharide deacetylase